jgi:hypothetical protein
MKFSDIYTVVKAHILAGDTRTVFQIEGSPGSAKSALGAALARDPDLGFTYSDDLNFAQLDIPDVGGLALIGDTTSDVLKFKKSPMMAPFQSPEDGGVPGPKLLRIEEVADATLAMQNMIRRVEWDRKVNNLVLCPKTFIIMFSNRSVDKSGAGRLSSKLKNAVTRITMEVNLDDWVNWAQTPEANIDPVLIQFLRFKPNLLDDFKPDAEFSPTPRQWEMVNRVPTSLRSDLFMSDVAGKVGEGPAAEYTAFRRIYESLVSFEEVVMNPTTVKIPHDLSAQYAIVGSVSHNTTAGNVERVAQFVERLPSDFGVMYWTDTIKKTPAVKTTKAFIKWATSAGNVVLN